MINQIGSDISTFATIVPVVQKSLDLQSIPNDWFSKRRTSDLDVLKLDNVGTGQQIAGVLKNPFMQSFFKRVVRQAADVFMSIFGNFQFF